MSISEKRKRERAEFENFVRISGKSFDNVSFGIEPEPDIIARKGSEIFGIEITNFHRQEIKRRESEEDRVVERALSSYTQRTSPHLWVDIAWAPHFEIRKRNSIELARKLASLIQRNIPQPGAVIHLDWRNFGSDLMTVISDIFIDRSLKLSRNHWYASRGGVVPNWDVATLQTEIDENNSKPAAYANIYAEVWLLIVSSFGAPSAWMEMTDKVKGNAFQATFDRVFLLSSFPFAAFELRVNR